MWIEASTPSDQYGNVQVSGPHENLIVKTAPLPEVLQKYSYFHYANFTGGTPSLGLTHLEFVDEPW
jgi:hypothetical protein